MNFFKSGLQTVLGTAETQELATGAETVSGKVFFFPVIDFYVNNEIFF